MVNSSQDKHGYKYTEEFGYIPEDWDIVSLDDLVAKDGLIRGPFGGTLKKEYFVNNGYKVYEQGNAIYASVELGNYYIDNEKFKELKRFEVKEGDFIVSCSGTIGKIYRLPKRLPKGIINQALLKITINENVISSDFFQIMFNWSKVQNSIIDSTQGGAMKNLVGMPIFKKTKMLKPQPLEQEKIADVLGDIDSLIDKTQQLINKKKDLKTATMQKLLTPKEDWEEKELGQLLQYEQPTNYIVNNAEYNDNNTIPVLTAGKSFILGYTDETNNIFNKIPVIIFDDFTTESKFVTFPFKVKSSAMKILKPAASSVNIKLVYELMQTIEFHIADHKRYWISEYQYLKIKLPPTDSERNRIATILSDMDSEIEALEKELNKYKDLKTGMMQELLTGKTRLI